MSLPSRKILILDDSPEDRETWRRYLKLDATHEYVFVERASIEEGVEALGSERPDAVLLDYHLPDGTGVDFIGRMAEHGGPLATPVVMLTGTGSEMVAVEAMKAGVQDYLMKNRLNPEALHRTINAAIYKADTDRLLAQQRAELEEAYRQAKEANARKDQFLATLSHELRTPLTPILATLSMPEMLHRSSPQELDEVFGLIRRNVELEARLIDDLLDITRISHGKLELHRKAANLHELIGHALDICRPSAQAKGVELVSSPRAAECLSEVDPARLQQVFWNLLNNAIKFTPTGGRVSIATRSPSPGRIEVKVEDTGLGIAPEKLERIFNAFEQADTRITRQFGGLGLGLAICKALVEAHGGCIQASSPGAGQGAVFQIELAAHAPADAREPAAPPAQRPAATAPSPAPPAGGGPAVLLVEDHVDSARVLATLMRRRGYRVLHAETVAAAEAVFRSEAVDAIVCDVGLPDGSGLDLIKILRALRPVPSIILSGFGESEAVRGSLEAGAQEHLTKPVEWPRLEAALHRVLAPRPAA